MSTKFSEFGAGGLVRTSDITVGLRGGSNEQFTNSGMADTAGNKIVTYSQPVGPGAAVNWIDFLSAFTGNNPTITASGTDPNVGLTLQGTGTTGFVNLAGTGTVLIPHGTTGQRPTGAAGMIRLNTTTGTLEFWNSVTNAWESSGSSILSSVDFITKTNQTALLPNSVPLSGLGTGFLSNTFGTGVLVSRTMTGTANRITVANGDGSGVPTFDISASYVGQASITTLGTIATGVWNATVIAGQYGGTGVANTGKTITLGGNLTTSGAFASTFTMTNTTNVTFPTSGTLATTSGASIPAVILGDTLYGSGVNTLAALAGNTTAVKQYLSQTGTGIVSAAPVWSTISGGDITGSALTEVNDTNVTLTLGGTPATCLLRAASITAGWTGQLAVSRGGTGVGSFTAYAPICGGTISTGALQSATSGSSGQLFQSAGNAALPSWTTATYPTTNTLAGAILRGDGTNYVQSNFTVPASFATNDMIYCSITNNLTALSSVNSSVLTTNATGVPTFVSSLTDGQIVIGSSTGAPLPAAISSSTGLAITNGHNSITPSISTQLANCFRLTLTSGQPCADGITAATTLYLTPYLGSDIDIYNGATWVRFQPAQLSITNAGLSASTVYDVFVAYNSGTPALFLLAWTNTTTRATALAYQNGVLVLSGSPSNRYVGTVYMDASTHFNDSFNARYIYNYYNRILRNMYAQETSSSWTYTTATWRQANANTANQLNFVVGAQEDEIQVNVNEIANNSGNVSLAVGVGLNSTSVNSATLYGNNALTSIYCPINAFYQGAGYRIGLNSIAWLEFSNASGTTTWVGTGAGLTAVSSQLGIIGTFRM